MLSSLLLLLLLLSGQFLISMVLYLRWMELRTWQRELVVYRLRFPRNLEPRAVTAFLTGLSGLVAPRRKRLIAVRAVAFEIVATRAGVTHHLIVPRSLAGIVLSQLRAALPSTAVDEDPGHEIVRPELAGELGLSSAQRPLRTEDPTATSAAILASLQPLTGDERATVQWVLGPTGPVKPVQPSRPWRANGIAQSLVENVPAIVRNGEALRAARAKQSSPLFLATGRLGVVAQSPDRARMILQRLTASFHGTSAPGAHLRRRAVPSRWTAWHMQRRAVPLVHHPCLLNAAELTALLGLPIGGPPLPGLQLGGGRRLAPSADIPVTGRVLGRSNFSGSSRLLAISPEDAPRHLHVIGPTGVGKSTLLLNLIIGDMAAGHGVIVIDPKSDLVAEVLDRVPLHRLRDVVLLDPTDDSRPVGLNILAGGTDARELVVDQVVGIFHQLYRDFWGPRTDDILRATLLTLLHQPGMTLCEVPLILTDPTFRRRLVGQVDDPIALGPFWGWYEGLSDAERTQAIGPVMNKLRAFLLRRRIRNVIGQAKPNFGLERALAERQIVLVSLAKGLLGDEAAALLGSLVIARLWQAVQGRAGLSPAARHPIFCHIDEVQDYLNLPTSLDDVLAQARGLGLSLTLAHQHLGQLPPAIRSAVLANARSRVLFQTSASDARVFARELSPHLDASDLQGLGPHEVVASIAVGARVAPPATGVTLPPPPSLGTAVEVRACSRARFGRDVTDVEASLRSRHNARRGPGAIGRAS